MHVTFAFGRIQLTWHPIAIIAVDRQLYDPNTPCICMHDIIYKTICNITSRDFLVHTKVYNQLLVILTNILVRIFFRNHKRWRDISYCPRIYHRCPCSFQDRHCSLQQGSRSRIYLQGILCVMCDQ